MTMEGFYRTLVFTNYSNRVNKAQKLECWEIVRVILRTFFQDTRKARVRVENAYGETDPNMRVGQYLWHTLQAHRVMDEFKYAQFNQHTNIVPSIINNLFDHCPPKVDVGIKKPKSTNM